MLKEAIEKSYRLQTRTSTRSEMRISLTTT